jgi:hypothetical protein
VQRAPQPPVLGTVAEDQPGLEERHDARHVFAHLGRCGLGERRDPVRAHAPVGEQRPDLVVGEDEPLPAGLVPVHGAVLAQPGQAGERVVQLLRVVEKEKSERGSARAELGGLLVNHPP